MITVQSLIKKLYEAQETGFDNLTVVQKQFLELQVKSLSATDLLCLQKEVAANKPVRQFVDEATLTIRNITAYFNKQEEQRLYRNETVRQLLSLYTDKKSGKVVDARKKLQQRYMFMPYKDQVLVMKAMLKGSKTDREWCYNTLRKRWSDVFEADLLNLWEEYHEERCGWLITRNCEVEVLREYVDELCYDSNYFGLCKRLVMEPWFTIDKERLRFYSGSDEKYLWILSQSRTGLLEKDALELIYKKIAGVIYSLDTETYPDEWFTVRQDVRQIFSDVNYSKVEDNFFMSRTEGMEKMLISMCRMGLEHSVQQFMEKDKAIHDIFVKERESEIAKVGGRSAAYNYDALYQLLKEFAISYAAFFPAEYEYVKKKYEGYFFPFKRVHEYTQDSNAISAKETKEYIAEASSKSAPGYTPLSKKKYQQLRSSSPHMNYLIDTLELEPMDLMYDDEEIPY